MRTRIAPHTNAPTRRKAALSLAAAVAAVLAAPGVQAASIQFGPATNITGDTDVFNLGTLNYAYDWNNTAQNVNGVAFTGTNSATAAGTNLTMTGFNTVNTTVFTSGVAPFSTLTPAYQAVLRGGTYVSTTGGAGVTMNNLTVGHVYATQFWINDPRPIAGRAVFLSSVGGNTVDLLYSAANVVGSPGQYSVGGFTADATTQAFSLTGHNVSGGSTSTQMTAIQVRNVTGIWSGAASGTWDGGAANFTGGQIFATVSGLVNAVGFADTDGFKNTVTNNNITVGAGGVSIGTVNLQNNAVAYTFNSADATGITGTTALNKTGTGVVNLTGANTFTGNTTVSAGSLVLKHTAALQNSTLTTANVVFDSSVGSNAFTFGGLSGSGARSLLNNAAVAVNLSVGKNNANTTYTGVLSGAGGSLTKIGSGTLTLGGVNTYTGNTTISTGKLSVTGSLNAGSGIFIDSGATLGGTGTVGMATMVATGSIEAGVGGAGKLTLSGLTFNGFGSVNFGSLSSYAAATGVQVTGAGLLNPLGGAGSVSINITSLAGITLGTPYKLIGNTGGVSAPAFAAFQLSTLPSRGVGVLNNTAGEITLTVNSTDYIKWTGTGTLANGWDTGTQNWKLNSDNSPTTYINTPGDTVVFDDSAAPTDTTVNLNTATVSPSSVTFANSSNTYTLQGTFGIAGLATLTKNGTGTAILGTPNSYTGATTVTQGVLNIRNANALGATSGNTVVSAGAALQIQGGISTAAEPLTLNGTGITNDGALRNVADNNTYAGLVTLGSTGVRINSLAGTLTLGNTGTITGSGFALTVGGAGNTTINSIIGTGAGTLTKDGNGTLILAGVNTYTGATTISAGTLQIGNGASGSISATSPITNNSNLVFLSTTNAQVDTAGVISGPGTVSYNGPGVSTSLLGQFQVTDVNTYTGPTTITNARVRALSATALGTGAGAVVTVNDGGQFYIPAVITVANNVVISGNGWLETTSPFALGAIRLQGSTLAGNVTMAANSRIGAFGGNGTITGIISGGFNLETIGQTTANILTFSGANTYTGVTTISSGVLSVATIGNGGVAGNLGMATADPFNLVLNGGALSYSGATASTDRGFTIANGKTGIIDISNAGTNLTISGIADFSSGNLAKSGAGTLTLTNDSFYQGTTIVSAGTLARSGGNYYSPADFTIGNTTTTAATFTLGGGLVSLTGTNVIMAATAATPLTTILTYNQTGGAFEFTNPVGFIGISNNGGTSNVNISAGTFTASNASGMNVGVRGDANLNISGVSTVVSLPTLTFGHPSTAGANSTVNLNGGALEIGAGRIVKASGTATFNFNGGILRPTVASTTFLTGMNIANVRNGGAIIDTNGLDITIGQSLTHSAIGGDNAIDGGLAKNGAGTLTLGGLNNYSGPTSVANGSLILTGSLSGAGTVAVAGTASFGGAGSAGTTTVAGGGTILAGSGGAGQLTLTGLTYSAAGNLNVGTLSNYAATPALQVSGVNALNPSAVAGSVSIGVSNLGSAVVGNTYKLVSYAGTIGGAGFSAFQLAPLPSRGAGTLTNVGSEILLTLDATDFVKWTGTGNLANGWETATQNWKLASNNAVTSYINTPADVVVFDDSASASNTTVGIDVANVSPVSVTFGNSLRDYFVQGAFGIAGATGVTKTGTGSVTITNANSYTGPTTISQGVVNIQNDSALGAASGGTTVAAGAALQIEGFVFAAADPLTLNGSGIGNDGALRNIAGSNTYAGLVTLGSSARINSAADTLTVSNTGTITGSGFNLTVGGDGNTIIGSIIGTGSGALVKDGGGTVTLSRANTYTGGTTVNAGILKAGTATALGDVASSITVASGGSLDMNGQTLQGYTQQISIGGVGAASAPTLGALGNTGVLNLNSIRGITLTGDTSVGGDGGRWDIGRVDFNVDPTIAVDHITGNGFILTKVGIGYLGLLTGSTDLAGFIINGGTVAPHENTSFGTGPVTINNGAILQPWGTNITFTNTFTVNNGTIQNDGHNNFYNSTVTIAGPTIFNPRLGGNIVFNGNITGAGNVTKIGPLSVFLNGDNSGMTGTYQNNESNTFFGAATGGSASAAFVLNAGNLAARTIGVFTVELGSLAGLGGNLGNDSAGSTVTFSIGGDDTDTTFSGSIVDTVGGGGTTGITKVGTGELTLNGPLTYTEVTTITDGTLNVNRALGAGANVVNADGGITNFGVSQTFAALNIADGATVVLSEVPPPAPAAFGAGLDALGDSTVQAVPEPGSIALLLGGVATLLGRRRRRG